MSGDQKYWFNGLPGPGINRSGYDLGAQKYWFNGLPAQPLFEAAVSSRIYAKSGGAWLNVPTPKVKSGGAWVTPTAVFAKSGGAWVQVYP